MNAETAREVTAAFPPFFTTVSSDKASALAGTVTLVLDTYVDAKIVQPKAIRFLKVKEV